MKKIFIALIPILLLFMQLTACSPNSESISHIESEDIKPVIINICVDLPNTYSKTIWDFFAAFPGVGSDYEILIETIPEEESERENVLKRIRTEILAGKGPDVFLCTSDLPFYHHSPLFPFPRQVMENNLFLPLDEYIKQAEYMEWDKLLPSVMDAGSNKDGQFLLPLTYNMKIFLLDKEEHSPGFEHPVSWDKLAESEDMDAQMIASSTAFYDLLGEFADYGSDNIVITEEELLDYSQRYINLLRKSQDITSDVRDTFIQDGHFTVATEKGQEPVNLGEDGAEFWMLSGCNIDGGTTVDVVNYAGINRNTAHPDEAFKVLDYLLSKQIQSNSFVYSQYLPVHMDLYSKENPHQGKFMNQWNFEQFDRLREEINVAKFYTPLDKAARDAYNISVEGDELKNMVHKQYVLMEMLLAES